MNYRDRCYDHFVSTHWQYTHSLSAAEFDHLWRTFKKHFNKFLPIDKSAEIIDIACGSGHFLYYLLKEGYKNAYGIDISTEQLETAKKQGIKNVIHADFFEYLIDKKETYDMLVANDIIEHLNKDEVCGFLDLARHALKPDAKILISTVNAQSLLGSSMVFIDFTHEIGLTPYSLSQVMRVCGFQDVKVFGEKPVPYDLRSSFRSRLWWIVDKLLKLYISVERGTGRGMRIRENILEPRMFAIGKK